jgi:acyl transferase domain-containing protein
LSDDEADDIDLKDGETYIIAQVFAQKFMELAEKTAAGHDFLSVKQLLQHAKMINSAKVARIKINKHNAWNIAQEELNKNTDKADREPTRQLKNGGKAFTGAWQRTIKETSDENKAHYQALAEKKNADVKASESEALQKTQKKAINQLKQFVSASGQVSVAELIIIGVHPCRTGDSPHHHGCRIKEKEKSHDCLGWVWNGLL